MKLIVSGGGTGGHVYPALAVVDALRSVKSADCNLPSLESEHILWIGSQGGMEKELVERQGIQFLGLAAGGLRGMGLGEMVGNGMRILSSIGHASRELGSFKPDAILATGGYACVAVTLAAWLRRIPVVIYLPDIQPGLAIRFLSRFAAKVTVTSEESRQYLPQDKVVETGYPVREDIRSRERASALQAFSLNPDTKTLLVFGGSRGARSINEALMAGLTELLPVCQVIHISGTLDADRVAEQARDLPEDLKSRYRHRDFLHDMASGLASADLAVARAGAATMGEFPAAELPSLLVPYPHSGQHQLPNAEHLARYGAARILADSQLEDKLVSTVLDMLSNGEELAAMSAAAKAVYKPNAASAIAEQLCLVAGLYGSGEGTLK